MEHVVLVDQNNTVLGLAPKSSIHTTTTPLHRGFSCFIFNDKKEVLITKRANGKQTFPGVWTNTVCGHPSDEESAEDAAKRRLMEELGLTVDVLSEVSPYQYRFADENGIVENEICPIIIGRTDKNPQPKEHEVEAWKWMKWEDFLVDITKHPEKYSPWSREEAVILQQIDSAPLV